jgi:hypothetical protein
MGAVSEPTTPPAPAPTARAPVVDPVAVLTGALVGLAILVPVSVLRVILDREINDINHSAWIVVLSIALLVGYVAAGAVGGLRAPNAPLSNGALAALGAVVLWLPIRVVIWLIRDEHRGLFNGSKPALSPGQLFGAAVLAVVLGAFGGFVSTHLVRRARAEDES